MAVATRATLCASSIEPAAAQQLQLQQVHGERMRVVVLAVGVHAQHARAEGAPVEVLLALVPDLVELCGVERRGLVAVREDEPATRSAAVMRKTRLWWKPVAQS